MDELRPPPAGETAVAADKAAALAARSEPGVEGLREALDSLRTDRHVEDNGLSYNDGWNDALDSVLPRLAATPAADSRPGPRFAQNPDVPWRDETMYYPDRATPAADSRGLDVERLARAMSHHFGDWSDTGYPYYVEAEAIAREYAALTDPDPVP